MLGKNSSELALFQMVDLESLVPQGHQLRKIDAALDLSFVREAVEACYIPGRGRPSIDPELVVRMMLLGVLYDLSDRQLCDELRMHAGFRWFCRLNFHDPVPDHSTLSRLRNERWAQSEIFTRLFEEVLSSCVKAGMASGRHTSIDGTQIQANASIRSMAPIADDDSQEELPAEEESQGEQPRGKKPQEEKPQEEKPQEEKPQEEAPQSKEPQPKGDWKGHGERYSNQTHRSRSDGDARLYRKGKDRGAKLSYLVHDLIDTKSRVILGRCTSMASASAEREEALRLLDEHEARRERLGLKWYVEILSADTGYGTGEFVADVMDRRILPHVPLQAKSEFEEIPSWKNRTFNLAWYRKRREKVRQAQARNEVRWAQQTHGYTVSRKLRVRSEHVFAEAKNEHGLGRARHRGLERVNRQSVLVATVQNLKRLSHTLWRKAQAGAGDSGFFGAFWSVLWLLSVQEWTPKGRCCQERVWAGREARFSLCLSY